MSINSSCSLNGSHPFCRPAELICFSSTSGSFIFLSFAATNTLIVLPLCILVFYVGYQRWRQQRSTSTITATSHVDVFTYHMMGLEIFGLVGYGFYCSGSFMETKWVMMVGFYGFSIILPGQNLFHCMTCVEHYLAVVHPITYLGLRNKGRATIRNISIGCAWLSCVGWLGLTCLYFPQIAVVPLFSLFALCFFVSTFCSLSVLSALSRPSPGEGVGGKERVCQSKQRAFNTIMAIMGTLLVRFAGLLICIALYRYVESIGGDACVVLKSAFWSCFPSSVVLPLLFLHRTGKLSCCRQHTESR